jgi:hypothetical protein
VVWNRNFYSKFHYYWFCFKFKDWLSPRILLLSLSMIEYFSF